MNYFLKIFLLFGLVFISCNENERVVPQVIDLEIKAVDASYLPAIQSFDVNFKNSQNQVQNPLEIYKQNGVNHVRIRLWHNPEDENASLVQVKNFVENIRQNGMKVWLTLHYSDTWADPSQQQIPAAWQNLNFSVLNDSVYQYTAKVTREIQPDIIQIGNEINNGVLFPNGNRWQNEIQFKQLINSGVSAVRDEGSNTKIMLHFAGIENATTFFSLFENADYDLMGISYYPFWHGKNLEQIQQNLTALNVQFPQDLVIAETAYPFTLEWNDNTHNVIGLNEQLILPRLNALKI